MILATESDAALYRNELDEIVRSRICRGNISFRQLCSECKGAFPTEVSAALGRLQIAARFDDTSADGALAIQSDPEPCPVDFEWRFTSSSAKLIADMALAAGKRILCLGTPSVFGAISLRREQAVMTWLVDRNPFFAATFGKQPNVVVRDISDLGNSIPARSVDIVVLDPPWYVQQNRLARCRILRRVSGRQAFDNADSGPREARG